MPDLADRYGYIKVYIYIYDLARVCIHFVACFPLYLLAIGWIRVELTLTFDALNRVLYLLYL